MRLMYAPHGVRMGGAGSPSQNRIDIDDWSEQDKIVKPIP